MTSSILVLFNGDNKWAACGQQDPHSDLTSNPTLQPIKSRGWGNYAVCISLHFPCISPPEAATLPNGPHSPIPSDPRQRQRRNDTRVPPCVSLHEQDALNEAISDFFDFHG